MVASNIPPHSRTAGSMDEEDAQLHPNVRRCVNAARAMPQRVGLSLSASSLERWTLDCYNAEYVVSFLQETPRITSLGMDCNLDGGALEVLTNGLAVVEQQQHQHQPNDNSSAVTTLSIWGDFSTDTNASAGTDDGSPLELLTRVFEQGSRSSMSSVTFWHCDFRTQRVRRSFRRFMKQCCSSTSSLRSLQFYSCSFGTSSSETLVRELSLHKSLEVLSLSFHCSDHFQAAENVKLPALILQSLCSGVTIPKLRVLKLLRCQAFDAESIQAANILIAKKGCALETLWLVGQAPNQPASCGKELSEFVESMKKANKTLLDVSISNGDGRNLVESRAKFSLARNRLLRSLQCLMDNGDHTLLKRVIVAMGLKRPAIGVSPLYLALSACLPKLVVERWSPSRKRPR